MPETQALRNKILEHLEEKDITQRQLSLLIDENASYLNEVLKGKKTGPKANMMLLTIVRVLGI